MDDIGLSWHRAELAGVRQDAAFDRMAVADVDPTSRLMVAAAPVLQDMAADLAGTRYAVLLADTDCRIVSRWFDGSRLGQMLDGVHAVRGAQFREDVAGTNGLGTPLELGKGLVVHGAEHYVEALRPFSCYGHPIRHPVTGRLAGVLDITGLATDANPLLAPLLTRAARDVEERLFAGAREAEQRLLLAFREACRHRSAAVVARLDDLVLASTAALDLLTAADHARLRGLGPGTATLTLDSGATVRVTGERVNGVGGAALYRLTAHERRDLPVPRGRAATGTGHDLARLRTLSGPVLVTGEPGSGRSTAARTLASTASGGAIRVLDAARIAESGAGPWAARARGLAANPRTTLIVEELQLVPDDVGTVLGKLAARRGGARLVFTCGPTGDLGPAAASVAAACTERVDLPPLRTLGAELPSIAARMLHELGGGESPRLTPTALEALIAQPWPGNLRELRAVLAHVTARRCGGDITRADLPRTHRANPAPARLGGMERAAYDAIVAALRATGGNKVHAAARLGISRTTLYARMRAFGL